MITDLVSAGYIIINVKRKPSRVPLPVVGDTQWSASLAITPLMLAERDREFLKQLRKNRDAEEKLMKDVEGWEVGTFYGHKVYKVKSGLSCTSVLFCNYIFPPDHWGPASYDELR